MDNEGRSEGIELGIEAMKNFLITLGVALAACGVAFGVFFALSNDGAMHRAAREGDAMAWLQTEFHLNGGQLAAIRKLHDDYGSECAAHCATIMAAKERAASAAEMANLEKQCVEAMTAHFQRVAAVMPAAESKRYLATVLPRIPGYEHTGAPNLRGAP
jgi:hypothetical protein